VDAYLSQGNKVVEYANQHSIPLSKVFNTNHLSDHAPTSPKVILVPSSAIVNGQFINAQF
jgi:hypothetical protein